MVDGQNNVPLEEGDFDSFGGDDVGVGDTGQETTEDQRSNDQLTDTPQVDYKAELAKMQARYQNLERDFGTYKDFYETAKPKLSILDKLETAIKGGNQRGSDIPADLAARLQSPDEGVRQQAGKELLRKEFESLIDEREQTSQKKQQEITERGQKARASFDAMRRSNDKKVKELAEFTEPLINSLYKSAETNEATARIVDNLNKVDPDMWGLMTSLVTQGLFVHQNKDQVGNLKAIQQVADERNLRAMSTASGMGAGSSVEGMAGKGNKSVEDEVAAEIEAFSNPLG